jgi:hypothetical protein
LHSFFFWFLSHFHFRTYFERIILGFHKFPLRSSKILLKFR